jgi:nucleoside-triphosphatase THEP1
MQAAIYFQIVSGTAYTYEKPVLSRLKQLVPELVVFDFDTQSDGLMARYAIELLEKAEKAVVILELQEAQATGLITFLEKVIACQNKCMVLLYGRHPLVQKMLKLLSTDRLIEADRDDKFMQKAVQFLSAGQL